MVALEVCPSSTHHLAMNPRQLWHTMRVVPSMLIGSPSGEAQHWHCERCAEPLRGADVAGVCGFAVTSGLFMVFFPRRSRRRSASRMEVAHTTQDRSARSIAIRRLGVCATPPRMFRVRISGRNTRSSRSTHGEHRACCQTTRAFRKRSTTPNQSLHRTAGLRLSCYSCVLCPPSVSLLLEPLSCACSVRHAFAATAGICPLPVASCLSSQSASPSATRPKPDSSDHQPRPRTVFPTLPFSPA